MMTALLHKYFNRRTLQRLCVFALLFLSACSKNDELSAGEDQNIADQSDCWQTKIVEMVLSQIDNLFGKSITYITNGGGGMIAVGFAVWMAFKLIKILPSFKEENLGEVWTEIGQKLFLCAFCIIAVSSGAMIKEVVQLFVVPIYDTLLSFGAQSLGTKSESIDLGIFGSITFKYNDNLCAFKPLDIKNSISGSILPMSECLICEISNRLNSGMQIGISLLGTWDIGAMFVGIVMILIFAAAKFGFIFFVVDSLFRLNFAVFLIPVLIIGIPFNYTRKWSKHGFLMFLNSSGILMFMGILVTIACSALELMLEKFSAGSIFTEENFVGQGPIMLAMLLISMLMVNIPGIAVALADKFIGGGGGMAFQKKISQFVVNTTKKAAAKVAGGISGGVTNVLTETMEKYEATREAADTMKQLKNKVDNLAGYNNDKA